jgi:hypothetical protein
MICVIRMPEPCSIPFVQLSSTASFAINGRACSTTFRTAVEGVTTTISSAPAQSASSLVTWIDSGSFTSGR